MKAPAHSLQPKDAKRCQKCQKMPKRHRQPPRQSSEKHSSICSICQFQVKLLPVSSSQTHGITWIKVGKVHIAWMRHALYQAGSGRWSDFQPLGRPKLHAFWRALPQQMCHVSIWPARFCRICQIMTNNVDISNFCLISGDPASAAKYDSMHWTLWCCKLGGPETRIHAMQLQCQVQLGMCRMPSARATRHHDWGSIKGPSYMPVDKKELVSLLHWVYKCGTATLELQLCVRKE